MLTYRSHEVQSIIKDNQSQNILKDKHRTVVGGVSAVGGTDPHQKSNEDPCIKCQKRPHDKAPAWGPLSYINVAPVAIEVGLCIAVGIRRERQQCE